MVGPTDSVLDVACRLPQVDCELGIATWGHSQGAYVAHLARNYEPRVRAACSMPSSAFTVVGALGP